MSNNKPLTKDLTGYRGTARVRIEKIIHALELAVRLSARLEEQARDPRFSPIDLQIRMETVRLTVKQCHLTLEELASENWKHAGATVPR